MYPFKISTIRTFYSLGATYPSSCVGLPKCTRNLMAHDPFNTRRADMKSQKTKAESQKAKNSRGVIKREVASDPNSLTIKMSAKKWIKKKSHFFFITYLTFYYQNKDFNCIFLHTVCRVIVEIYTAFDTWRRNLANSHHNWHFNVTDDTYFSSWFAALVNGVTTQFSICLYFCIYIRAPRDF